MGSVLSEQGKWSKSKIGTAFFKTIIFEKSLEKFGVFAIEKRHESHTHLEQRIVLCDKISVISSSSKVDFNSV